MTCVQTPLLRRKEYAPLFKLRSYHKIPIFVLVTYILTSLSSFIGFDNETSGANMFFAVLILQIITFVLPGLFYCRINGTDYINKLNLKRFNVPSLIFIIPSTLLLFFSTAFIRLLGIYLSDAQYAPSLPVDGISFSNVILILLVYCVCPAVCEEFVFRGIVLSSYKKYGALCGVILSSALFSMLHFSISDFFLYFVSGVILSCTALITRSVFPCMVIHFLHNAITIFFEGVLWKVITIPDNASLFVFIIGSLLLLLLFVYFSHAEYILGKYSYTIPESDNPQKRELMITVRDLMISLLSPSFLMCVAYYAIASVVKLR